MHPARRLLVLVESVHAVTYFAPECAAAFEDAGYRGFWRGYFAGRAAPLGAVGPATVTAAFHGFHPDFVARAIPSIWELGPPPTGIEARLAGVDRVLGPIAAEHPGAVAEADELAWRLVDGLHPDHRPLFLANRALERPGPDHLSLWHATTVLREHRGDGHVTALRYHELGPLAAHQLRLATQRLDASWVGPFRGFSDADWTASRTELTERGLLDGDGAATAAGRDLHERVEADTDRLAPQPGDLLHELERALRPVHEALIGVIRFPNPMGLPPLPSRSG